MVGLPRFVFVVFFLINQETVWLGFHFRRTLATVGGDGLGREMAGCHAGCADWAPHKSRSASPLDGGLGTGKG